MTDVMPDWLKAEENYTPQSDKDAFIDKSIMSLIKIIGGARTANTGERGVNTELKTACTFILLVLISASGSTAFILAAGAYLLCVLSLMRAQEILSILRGSFTASLFTLILLLPALNVSFMTAIKVFLSVTAAGILARSAKWHSVTVALHRFFIPDMFIFILDTALRYIFILSEYASGLFYALRLRSVGRNKGKYSSLSGVAGTVFLKSGEMADEMRSAMECRGFTGEYRVYGKLRFGAADVIYAAANLTLILSFIYLERV
ncbi:MAG: energy-coupling factor transporter transmembrane component T [Bacillota bacterium]|nr:energy-coupling factor transporter transmembrane component T [Bacillota bacterium]